MVHRKFDGLSKLKIVGFSSSQTVSLPEGNYCNEKVFINQLLQQFYWQTWFTMVFVTSYSYYGLLLQLPVVPHKAVAEVSE